MFDNQKIFGTHISKKDDKGRIFISKRMLTPEKEKLVLMRLSSELCVLCSQSIAELEVNKINENINIYTVENKVQETKRELEKLKSIRTIIMDSEGRINIGDVFGSETIVKEIGACDRIYLEPVARSK